MLTLVSDEREWLTTSLAELGVWSGRADSVESIIGRRVRVLRERQGLSQNDLGGRLRIPMRQNTVAKLEAGLRPLRVAEVVDVATALGVPVVALWPEVDTLSEDSERMREANVAVLWQAERVAEHEGRVSRARRALAEAEHDYERAVEEQQRLQQQLDEVRGARSDGGVN